MLRGLNVCKQENYEEVKLYTVDYLRNHVQLVHGITLRLADRAQERQGSEE